MARQETTTPKRGARVASKTIKNGRLVQKNGTTGNGSTSAGRAKPVREMTLEELSLRAYKLTYKRLHGSKKTKK